MSQFAPTQQEQLQVDGELLPGEQILWMGRPETRVIFHSSDLYLIPFSLMWGGFSLFWEYGVSKAADGHFSWDFMSFWGVPFVVMGQYFIWGRFFSEAWLKKRTLYVLTSSRVLLLQGGFRQKIRSGAIDDLGSRTLTLRSDGIGTIDFQPEASPWGRTGRDNHWSSVSRYAFVDVANAQQVKQQIEIQRAELRSTEN